MILKEALNAQAEPSVVWIEDSLYAAKELQTREGFLWQSLCKAENIPIHLPLSLNWPKPPPAAQASAKLLGRGFISF